MSKIKKVIVIGCAGSGKSCFARALAEKTALPLYHLDRIWWREDGTNVDRAELDERLAEILALDEWIIDGNYQRTMEKRMEACDTVFFFDIDVEDCIEGIKARRGKERPDMPWKDAPEDADEEFMAFVKSYNTENRPRVCELLDKYKEKNIVTFKTRAQADELLQKCTEL